MLPSLRVLIPSFVGGLFFIDLLYRGQTGKKTLYKTLQVIVSALCFVVSLLLLLPYSIEDGVSVWFALHMSRIIYSVFRRRNVKHNALLSFHAMVFYLLYLLWEQLRVDPTDKQRELLWWFIWFDLCGVAKDTVEWHFVSYKNNNRNIRSALVNLLASLLWIFLRIVYFGYCAIWYSESKTFIILYTMIWLAQLKPAIELLKR